MLDASPSWTASDTSLAGRHSIGPVSWITHAADVRYVRWAGQEIIRRIFVTLRDRQWQEVPPSAWSCQATRKADSLQLDLSARHDAEGSQFGWQGVFAVNTRTREISFTLTGTVPNEMIVNRLGLVVLHPTDGLIGGSATVSGPSGQQTIELSERIHAQPIVNSLPTGMTAPFTTLTTTFVNDRSVRFDFSGELFEIEDQRNFGDTSFKSYCPPLALGFPRVLQRGTEIRHSVICHASDTFGTVSPDTTGQVADTVQLPPRRAGATVPRIGAQFSAKDVIGCCLTHLRVDIAATSGKEAFAAVRDRLRPDQRLELGLELGQGDINDELIAAVCDDPQIARILLLEAEQTVIGRELAERASRILERHGCRVPVATAVNGYFVELNRGAPSDIGETGLAIAVCPTVHSGDVLTATENVAALPAIVRTARELFPGREVTVSPLTLHLGPEPDPDVYAVASLAWLVGSIETVGHIGLSSITLGKDVLPDPAAHPELADARSSVLALLNTARTSSRVATAALPQRRLHAVAWQENPAEENILVANLADAEQNVTLGADQAPLQIRTLWAPLDPAPRGDSHREFVVPAYGVVHVLARTE